MSKKDFEISSGNIFADLGMANPEERLAKANLAMQITLLIREKKMSQKEAAEFLGIDQPKVSALQKGKLAGFSLERLFKLLNMLGQDIIIKVAASKNKTKKKSSIKVNIHEIPKKPTNQTIRTPLLAKKGK